MRRLIAGLCALVIALAPAPALSPAYALSPALQTILFGAQRAWTPAVLQPIAFFDPSDISAVCQDTACNTPVTADGQSVARINDKGSAGQNLVQATASKRPIYRTSGGLSWLEFDGVDDEMQSSASFSLVQLHEMTAAVRWSAATNTSAAFLSYAYVDNTAAAELAAFAAAGNARFRTRYPSLDTFSTGLVILQSTDQVYAQSRVSLTDARQYLNGGSEATFTTTTTNFATPGFLRIGRHTNTGQYFAGRFYGAVVSPVLDALQRAKLTRWIGGRAGLSL